MFAVILYYQVICHQLQIQFDGDWQLSVTIGHCHLHKAVHLCMITYMADIHVRQMEKRIKRLRNYKKTIHVFGRKECLRCKNVNKLDMKIQLYGRQVPTCVNNEENFEEFPLYLESHVLILY